MKVEARLPVIEWFFGSLVAIGFAEMPVLALPGGIWVLVQVSALNMQACQYQDFRSLLEWKRDFLIEQK